MSIIVKQEKFYQTSEAARAAGISRSTLLRWVENGTVDDASHRDRRGWRLFSQADVDRIAEVAGSIS